MSIVFLVTLVTIAIEKDEVIKKAIKEKIVLPNLFNYLANSEDSHFVNTFLAT